MSKIYDQYIEKRLTDEQLTALVKNNQYYHEDAELGYSPSSYEEFVRSQLSSVESALADVYTFSAFLDTNFNASDTIHSELKKLKDELHEEKWILQDVLDAVLDEMHTRRDGCDHEWKEIDWDSHYTYYRCDKCGEEMRQ